MVPPNSKVKLFINDGGGCDVGGHSDGDDGGDADMVMVIFPEI
jgi:hypothetical protein